MEIINKFLDLELLLSPTVYEKLKNFSKNEINKLIEKIREFKKYNDSFILLDDNFLNIFLCEDLNEIIKKYKDFNFIFYYTGEEEKESKKEEKEEIKENYLQIKLTIPLDKIISANVKDFESYLEDGKYKLINVYRKVNGFYEIGYIIYYGHTPIAAAYECKYGVLLGKDACEKIEELLKDENSVIDVYEFDEKKLTVLLDEFPEMKIEKEQKEDVIDVKLYEKEEAPILTSYEEDVELSREELLKKLGISEPDEGWIESILEDLLRPSDEELKELKNRIEREIYEKIKNIDGVDDVYLDINVKWENNRYYIYGDITVKRKKILGIIKKDVDPSIIKFEIDNIIKKHLSKYTSRLSLHIE